MPKGIVNTYECRKIEILGILMKEHALSAPEIAKRMRLTERSVNRYLRVLRAEKRVYRRFQLFIDGARRPTFFYSFRRE